VAEETTGNAAPNLDAVERLTLRRLQAVQERILSQIDGARGAVLCAVSLARKGPPARPEMALDTARELLLDACGSAAALDELAQAIGGSEP